MNHSTEQKGDSPKIPQPVSRGTVEGIQQQCVFFRSLLLGDTSEELPFEPSTRMNLSLENQLWCAATNN